MDRLRFRLFAVFITGLLCPQIAGAQTAANIAIVSGNGQVTCPLCVTPQRNPRIQPLIVKVTDASGKPVPNQEVDWSVAGFGPTTDTLNQLQTFTDASGLSQNLMFETGQGGISTSGFLQSFTTASLPTNGANVIFYHTQSLTDPINHAIARVGAVQLSPLLGDPPLTGVAGSTGTIPIHVRVDAFGIGLQNVSVRLIQEDPTNPGTISCQTGAGADPGSVLTDQNGEAFCTPVFGGKGQGSFNVLVGGVTQDQVFLGTGLPVGFIELFGNQFNVTAVTPGAIQIVSGNNQNVNQGQNAARLIGKITDSTGSAAIGGQTVTWSVTPSGAATLSNTVATSDANGLISTDVQLSSTAIGTIQVKATLNSSISATFNITTILNITLTTIQKVSGDQQTAAVNTAFTQPLIVQVNSTSGAAAGVPVQFTITGPATLSSQNVTTDNAGQARVNVQAGGTAGAVTVTAATGNLAPVNFALTVGAATPPLTASSFVNAAGQRTGLSPCSLAIVTGTGLAPGVQGLLTPNAGIGPNPLTFALPQGQSAKITVNNVAAPILSVSNANGQEQITFQVPCETTPGTSVPVTVSVGASTVPVNIAVLPASPGLYETKMSDGVLRAVLVRPDGTFASLENPVRRGEIIRTYVTGLGPVAPPEATNALPTPGTDSLVLGQVIVGVNNSGTRLILARLAPNLIGVYEIAFQVPADAPPGNDIIFSVGVNVLTDNQTRYSQGSKIPIL